MAFQELKKERQIRTFKGITNRSVGKAFFFLFFFLWSGVGKAFRIPWIRGIWLAM